MLIHFLHFPIKLLVSSSLSKSVSLGESGETQSYCGDGCICSSSSPLKSKKLKFPDRVCEENLFHVGTVPLGKLNSQMLQPGNSLGTEILTVVLT